MPPWFRFYSEAITDRKIDRICRSVQQPKALVIGAWTILLAIGSDSPERGCLLLTDDIPFTEEDLADELGLDLDLTRNLLTRFERFKMLYRDDGVIYLTNWGKRQFNSDDGATRVRRYRERQQGAQDKKRNADVTLQSRYGNVPDTEQNRSDTDTETETEQTTDGASAEIPAAGGDAYDLLAGFGIAEPTLTACARYPAALVRDYIEAARAKKGLHNPQGWVVRGLQSGQPPPNARAPARDRNRFIEGEFADVIEH
jgi:hypothetical protein